MMYGHDRIPSRAAFATMVTVMCVCVVAAAHSGDDSGGGFLSGFSHPIGGLDHVLAMVAVGLWGAQLGAPQLWLLPIAFPMMMAFGAAMGLMGFPLPGVEIGIACSAIALGLVVAMELKPKAVALSLVLVGFFAVFHGHAHGTELPPGESGLWYSAGFVVSTGLLHAAGIATGSIHRWNSGAMMLRGAGACVFAGGVFFLFRSVGWIA